MKKVKVTIVKKVIHFENIFKYVKQIQKKKKTNHTEYFKKNSRWK